MPKLLIPSLVELVPISKPAQTICTNGAIPWPDSTGHVTELHSMYMIKGAAYR